MPPIHFGRPGTGTGHFAPDVGGRRAKRMTGDELVEHLGPIAVADADEEAAALARLLDCCWSPQARVN